MNFNKTTAFPFALPEKPLWPVEPDFLEEWQKVHSRLKARMKKLRAVDKSFADEDTDKVAYAIQRVFTDDRGVMIQDKNGNFLLDTLDATAIRKAVKPVMPYVHWKEMARFPNAVAIANAMFVSNGEWSTVLRNLGIGGSNTGVMSGIRRYESSTERSAYREKTALQLTGMDDATAFIFQYGHEREPIVIDTFCRKTGATVVPCPFMFQSRKYPWMTANIDAVVIMPDGTWAIFEAKTTNARNEAEWKLGPPVQYLRQPLHYMAVLDDPRIKRAYIGGVISNSLNDWYCHPIERDPKAEAELICNETAFYERYLKPGIVPDWSGEKDKDLFTFFTYEKRSDDVTSGVDKALDAKTLPELQRWNTLNAERQKQKAALDALEEEMANIALELYDSLGADAKSGYLDDGTGMRYTVACKVTNRTSIDKEALQLISPEVFAQVAKTTASVSAPSITYKRAPKPKKPAGLVS